MAINLETAKSGLLSEQKRLEVSTHNTANLNTPKFRARVATLQERPTGGVEVRVDRVEVSEEGQKSLSEAGERGSPDNNVDLVDESVSKITARAGFQANSKVLKTQDKTIGTLLDAIG